MKSFRKFLHRKTPPLGLRIFEIFPTVAIVAVVVISGGVAYAVVSNKNNHQEQSPPTTNEPSPILKVDTSPVIKNTPSPQPVQQSTKMTSNSSSTTNSNEIAYTPYDSNGSPKDIYGCVMPPTNVSNVQIDGINQTAYAGCIRMYKPSWCYAQASDAYSVYSPSIIKAESTYDIAKAQDKAYIQKGQALGGVAGQQMISAGNGYLIDDQTTYRTTYDAAYDIYSDALISANQQGGCNNSIPTYKAPVY